MHELRSVGHFAAVIYLQGKDRSVAAVHVVKLNVVRVEVIVANLEGELVRVFNDGLGDIAHDAKVNGFFDAFHIDSDRLGEVSEKFGIIGNADFSRSARFDFFFREGNAGASAVSSHVGDAERVGRLVCQFENSGFRLFPENCSHVAGGLLKDKQRLCLQNGKEGEEGKEE